MASLLVTNDFPPKLGGIQSVLWEFWRRLDPSQTTVLTTAHPGAKTWDAEQRFRVERVREPVLLPHPWLISRVNSMIREIDADIVFVDPMLPLGLIIPRLDRDTPVVVLAHGAEITVPGRFPIGNLVARRVLRSATGVLAFGGYPATECLRAAAAPLRILELPCGIDTARFFPPDNVEKAAARARYGFDAERPLILGQSRLVPRKGFDVLIDAVASLDTEVCLGIGGVGRDEARLRRRVAERGITDRVKFLGRIPDSELAQVFGMADVFAMLCRDRWGGLEAEGFGIVFVEAQACGVPVVAGRSGGSHEAVVDGETGFVVDPRSVDEVAATLSRLLNDAELRSKFGAAARSRAVGSFDYTALTQPLARLAEGDLSVLEMRSA